LSLNLSYPLLKREGLGVSVRTRDTIRINRIPFVLAILVGKRQLWNREGLVLEHGTIYVLIAFPSTLLYLWVRDSWNREGLGVSVRTRGNIRINRLSCDLTILVGKRQISREGPPPISPNGLIEVGVSVIIKLPDLPKSNCDDLKMML
jgi:hypothetical protein